MSNEYDIIYILENGGEKKTEFKKQKGSWSLFNSLNKNTIYINQETNVQVKLEELIRTNGLYIYDNGSLKNVTTDIKHIIGFIGGNRMTKKYRFKKHRKSRKHTNKKTKNTKIKIRNHSKRKNRF